MNPRLYFPIHRAGRLPRHRAAAAGFSLIELLIVVAIIGILASLIIAQISNATADSRRIVSRQHQVVLQSAINSWVIQQVTPRAGAAASNIADVRTAYNAMTTAQKLAVIKDELDPDTADHFVVIADPEGIQSDAMKRIGAHITLPAWAATATGYPQVNLNE